MVQERGRVGVRGERQDCDCNRFARVRALGSVNPISEWQDPDHKRGGQESHAFQTRTKATLRLCLIRRQRQAPLGTRVLGAWCISRRGKHELFSRRTFDFRDLTTPGEKYLSRRRDLPPRQSPTPPPWLPPRRPRVWRWRPCVRRRSSCPALIAPIC